MNSLQITVDRNQGKSTKNVSIYNMAAMNFSRQNSLVTLRNQNKHCYLTEKI